MLLGGVALGYFYAVEAAAMGAFALLLAGLVTGRLRGPVLNKVLNDAIGILTRDGEGVGTGRCPIRQSRYINSCTLC